jgi:hypothetical protein
MGIKFDRILDGFEAPLEKVSGLQKALPGKISGTAGAGFLMSHAPNDSFIAVNRLLGAGEEVFWVMTGPQAGAFYIPSKASTRAAVEKLAADLGLNFEAAARPSGEAMPLRRPRIALADQYGGSMPSGWTRWLLEQYEFPFDVLYPRSFDAGNLAAKYDVIVLPSGVGPAPAGAGRGGGRGGAGAGTGRGGSPPAAVPAEYQAMQGTYTAAATFPELRKFVEAGGTIVAVGRSAMNLAQLFELPVGNHLTERAPDGSSRPVSVDKFYVPGSILRVAVDTTTPIAHGIPSPVDVFFDNSPVFELNPDASLKGVRPVAWFDTAAPLRSGWAFGQGYLEGGVQAIDAAVGNGRLFLFAPEITFRAQPHGTFKFLFNGLYLATRKPVGTH